MATKPSPGANTSSEIVLKTLESCDQLIVETCNSTYVFLWDTLYCSRLIRCSNEYIDLGNIHLFGSYSGELEPPELETLCASGRLRVGESMLYAEAVESLPSSGRPAILTSAVVSLRRHHREIQLARPSPGLRQPQSHLQQKKLSSREYPSVKEKFDYVPVLCTPFAPRIPKSAVPSQLLALTS